MEYNKNGNHSFVMLSRELLKSPSWRNASINCRKLLDFLFEEHLSKGGKSNGDLKATYCQLVAAGISRRLIHRTITEAEHYGLIRVERGGRRGCTNDISTFTLTFIKTFNGAFCKPTDDWAKIDIKTIKAFQLSKNIKSWVSSGIATVPHPANSQFH